jgi:excisionase family DNA binding protein
VKPSSPTPTTSSTTPAPGAIVTTAGGIVPELLTTKQAAELLAVGERTLWRWSRSGLAPRPVKIGLGPRAAVRFRRAELMTWLAAGCPRTDGNGRAAG